MPTKKITESLVRKMAIGDEIRDTEIIGFFVRKLASKTTFYYSYLSPVSAKRRNTAVGSYGNLTVDLARQTAKNFAADVTKGIDPLSIKQELRENSHREKEKTLDHFLDHGFKTLTPSEQYHKAIKIIRREFKNYLYIDMADIDSNELNKWKLADKRKPSTVNRYLNELRGALTKAVSEGLLAKSPMPNVPPLKEDKKKRVRFLTQNEEAILMAALDDRETFHRHGGNNYCNYYMDQEGAFTDHLKPMIIVAIYAGLRPGELFNLKVRDLDFDNQAIFIVGEKETVDNIETKGTKTMQTRVIPMHDKIRDALRTWLKDNPSDHLVFPSPVTGARFDNIKKGWRALVTRTGFTAVTLYTLRHTFGTRLAQKRVDLETIRDLMGHESIETTQQYLQTNDETKGKAINLL